MRIAVTYDQGNVFQHFGRTEQFKIYEAEDGKIISSEVRGTDGTGHEALAGLLASLNVDAVICGGRGEGMKNALAAAGIAVCPGAEGDADSAVEAYLRGELAPGDANCDHHHEEEEESGGCGPHCPHAAAHAPRQGGHCRQDPVVRSVRCRILLRSGKYLRRKSLVDRTVHDGDRAGPPAQRFIRHPSMLLFGNYNLALCALQ